MKMKNSDMVLSRRMPHLTLHLVIKICMKWAIKNVKMEPC